MGATYFSLVTIYFASRLPTRRSDITTKLRINVASHREARHPGTLLRERPRTRPARDPTRAITYEHKTELRSPLNSTPRKSSGDFDRAPRRSSPDEHCLSKRRTSSSVLSHSALKRDQKISFHADPVMVCSCKLPNSACASHPRQGPQYIAERPTAARRNSSSGPSGSGFQDVLDYSLSAGGFKGF